MVDPFRQIGRIIKGVQSHPDASGKVVEKVVKDIPIVMRAAEAAAKAAIKIITKR